MDRRQTLQRSLLALAVWPAAVAGCAGGAIERVEAVTVPPPAPTTSAPVTVPSAEPAAAAPVRAPPPPFHEVNAGYEVEPSEPAPARPEMAVEAALVWEVIPAPANPSGPIERDTTITRYVVQRGGRAEVVAERREAVFGGADALWHLARRDEPVVVEDCAQGGKRVRRTHHQLVFESLEGKRRTVAPMEGHVASGEWARLDLEAMVGPWVVATVDHFSSGCEGRPFGSPYRVVVDLDRAGLRTFALPAGSLEQHRAVVRDVLARGCGGGGSEDEIKAGEASLHYDREGNLVVQQDFFAYTAPVCFHGIAHVFVGTYALLPEVAPHGRLPGWLRSYLAEHPSRSVSAIPIGREEAARKAFERLPAVAPRLPRDSTVGSE